MSVLSARHRPRLGLAWPGWRHGNQWCYQEIQVFINTSCLKPVQTAWNEGAQAGDQYRLVPTGSPLRLSLIAILRALEQKRPMR